MRDICKLDKKVDRDLFKEYINQKHPNRMRIDQINDITIYRVQYDIREMSKESRFYEEAKGKGYAYVDMIRPTWDGWKVHPSETGDYAGTWIFSENRRSNRFSLIAYKEWVRSSKLEKLGIV